MNKQAEEAAATGKPSLAAAFVPSQCDAHCQQQHAEARPEPEPAADTEAVPVWANLPPTARPDNIWKTIAALDAWDDDEEHAFQIVTNHKPKQKMPAMPKPASQTERKANDYKLTEAKIRRVCQWIRDHPDQLPEELAVDDGELLSLMDSGSQPHVADKEKHFPGATLTHDDDSKSKFATATGELFNNNGSMTIPAKTEDGHAYDFNFKNAPVTMRIISTGLLTDEDDDVLYKKTHGTILHPDGSTSNFYRIWGVYFIKLRVPMDYLVGANGKVSQCLSFGRQR